MESLGRLTAAKKAGTLLLTGCKKKRQYEKGRKDLGRFANSSVLIVEVTDNKERTKD